MNMPRRKLFCELSPFCYRISVWKCRIIRYLTDVCRKNRFAKRKETKSLSVLIYRHKSLIRRKLKDVDPSLQENKAMNLSLAAPRIDGAVIRPGEMFSLWRLVGRTSAAKGYREGLLIKQGKLARGIGGGLCQLSNMIHWMVLHSPLEIIEHHHHDGRDLFPDFGRRVPFGVGTSISYNYLDYRFKNTTEQTFQLRLWSDNTYLYGELRAERALPEKYHIRVGNEHFAKENGKWYRNNRVYRLRINKQSGKEAVQPELLKVNHAEVMYDEQFISPDKKRTCPEASLSKIVIVTN